MHASVHETNSLIEHDTQKSLNLERFRTQSTVVDNGMTPKGEPSLNSGNVEGAQGEHQLGGSNAIPNLVQNRPTQLDPSRTD